MGFDRAEFEKQQNNEETTKLNFITPIIKQRWGNSTDDICMEYYFTAGEVKIGNKKVKRGEPKKADYLLLYHNDIPLALVEAKGMDHSASEGYNQVIEYAKILDVPFAYATNGDDLIEEDMITGINCELKMRDFPIKEDLWKRYIKEKGLTSEELEIIDEPFYVDTSSKNPKMPRYYQRIAINRVTEAIAKGEKRILLVMATGTGKTFTSFQIVWKLWKSKTKKRILYLVDRNILADQTMQKDFKPFVDSNVMVKINNSRIDEDKGSYEVYTGLYQQLTDSENDYYKSFDPDFFDLIVVDECHRGSADEDGNWHKILEYFKSATQIGLTATPKEEKDVSTQHYFGEAIYTYSLKQGIEDGFLAPYRVISVELDVDRTGYHPKKGELDVYGRPLEDRVYEQNEFERILTIDSRTQAVAQRITDYLKDNNCRYAKTIVFCVTTDHASRLTRALRNLNSDLVQENPKYIMQITGDDDVGKKELSNFAAPNEKYPVIAVTSELLSTGVDVETCELIVLDKNINSMTMFKQIIGRGTRIKENFVIDEEKHSKMYFTIIDFRKNYLKFQDPAFDGMPVCKYDKGQRGSMKTDDGLDGGSKVDVSDKPKIEKRRVLGQTVGIAGEKVILYDEHGKEVIERVDKWAKNNIITQYDTVEKFREKFETVDNIDSFLSDLLISEDVISNAQKEIGFAVDKYDIALYVGYDIEPKSKEDRLEKVFSSDLFNSQSEERKRILKAILNEYLNQDFAKLKDTNAYKLQSVVALGYSPVATHRVFGGNKKIYLDLMNEFEKILFKGDK